MIMTKTFSWKYADRRNFQEVVDGVYIGPISASKDVSRLKQHGITTLVAIRTAATAHIFKANYPELFRYEVLDLLEGSLLALLPIIKGFIDACRARQERLLFYDETGNSKAPLLVCGYLMDSKDVSASEAYRLLKSQRLSISFNEHEKYQLQEYELLKVARNDVVAHSYTPAEIGRGNLRRKYDDTEGEAQRRPIDVAAGASK